MTTEYSNSFPANANYVSSAMAVQYVAAGFKLKWTGLDAVNATVGIQVSLEGTEWNDIPESDVTLDSASDAQLIKILVLVFPWLRVVYNKGGNTMGNISWAYRSSI